VRAFRSRARSRPELKQTIRRKIARYDRGEYQDWLVRHPEEAALLDEQ